MYQTNPDYLERAARFLGYTADHLERGKCLADALDGAGAPLPGPRLRGMMTDALLRADALNPGADILTVVRAAERALYRRRDVARSLVT
jgi:hypothetical protein